jgi:hypothetical protein
MYYFCFYIIFTCIAAYKNSNDGFIITVKIGLLLPFITRSISIIGNNWFFIAYLLLPSSDRRNLGMLTAGH